MKLPDVVSVHTAVAIAAAVGGVPVGIGWAWRRSRRGFCVSNSLPAEPEVPKSPAVVSCQTAVAIAAAVGGVPV